MINEFKITMPSKGSGLSIARKDMPQIKSVDYPEYVRYLKSHGITLTEISVPAKSLKPTQSVFHKDKVEGFMSKKGNKIPKPPIVSKDMYITDGHHRWIAMKNMNSDMNILKANANIDELLVITHKFPKVQYANEQMKNKENTMIKEAKMTDAEVLAAAKKLAKNGKDEKAKEFGAGLVSYYAKEKSFHPNQVSGLQNIMKKAGFQLASENWSTAPKMGDKVEVMTGKFEGLVGVVRGGDEQNSTVVIRDGMAEHSYSIAHGDLRIFKESILEKFEKKKKLDKVGKEDADVDNDGDVDESDKYLKKRREAIKKSIKKDK